ncbi:hypothetical protein [Streptomyces roseolus]|uniref:hypothetical protein n=1 Tax=Streptomyces roseolus TaxID=67358 RepID=UPI0016787768|nr:hypothetical protein [Streptomyces roseolus]GGR51830.1 hypothetical protein GCM10010282_50960 [Streptomyces roseolus]
MTEALLERLRENCATLGDGYRERVEYKLPVKYHDKDTCTGGAECACPVREENRTRLVRRSGLLEQLREFQKNRDTDRNPKAARGAPRIKTAGRPPGDVTGFLALDEITCDAYMSLDLIFIEAGRDRTWLSAPLKGVFQGLPYQVAQFIDARPDLAHDTLKLTDKWVRQAKSALRVNASDAMFGDTVCGNCGGGLSITWDNSSDVRCVGTPETPPCGETYPMSEWVALYEKGKRDV